MLQLNYDSPTYLDPSDARTSEADLKKQARLSYSQIIM